MDPICSADLFFFYGSLRHGLLHFVELGLEGRIEPVGEGWCPGRLHDLGPYPGLVDDPTGRVFGEVSRIRDLDLAARIEDLEIGYDYDRVRRVVAGGPWSAWVYRYIGPVPEDSLVPGGDWKEHLMTRGVRP